MSAAQILPSTSSADADAPAEGVSAGDAPLRVSVHRSLEQLRELESPWRALLAQGGTAGPFSDHAWACTWAELFTDGERRRPHVLAVREGERVIGIAPWLWIAPERRWAPPRLGFLGAERTAWEDLDVLCAPEREADVAQALYAHLFGPDGGTGSPWS